MNLKIMKKIYQKPSMLVIKLQNPSRLLAGSDYDDEISHVPGQPTDDMNKLA